jgi:hypothetical protein
MWLKSKNKWLQEGLTTSGNSTTEEFKSMDGANGEKSHDRTTNNNKEDQGTNHHENSKDQGRSKLKRVMTGRQGRTYREEGYKRQKTETPCVGPLIDQQSLDHVLYEDNIESRDSGIMLFSKHFYRGKHCDLARVYLSVNAQKFSMIIYWGSYIWTNTTELASIVRQLNLVCREELPSEQMFLNGNLPETIVDGLCFPRSNTNPYDGFWWFIDKKTKRFCHLGEFLQLSLREHCRGNLQDGRPVPMSFHEYQQQPALWLPCISGLYFPALYDWLTTKQSHVLVSLRWSDDSSPQTTIHLPAVGGLPHGLPIRYYYWYKWLSWFRSSRQAPLQLPLTAEQKRCISSSSSSSSSSPPFDFQSEADRDVPTEINLTEISGIDPSESSGIYPSEISGINPLESSGIGPLESPGIDSLESSGIDPLKEKINQLLCFEMSWQEVLDQMLSMFTLLDFTQPWWFPSTKPTQWGFYSIRTTHNEDLPKLFIQLFQPSRLFDWCKLILSSQSLTLVFFKTTWSIKFDQLTQFQCNECDIWWISTHYQVSTSGCLLCGRSSSLLTVAHQSMSDSEWIQHRARNLVCSNCFATTPLNQSSLSDEHTVCWSCQSAMCLFCEHTTRPISESLLLKHQQLTPRTLPVCLHRAKEFDVNRLLLACVPVTMLKSSYIEDKLNSATCPSSILQMVVGVYEQLKINDQSGVTWMEILLLVRTATNFLKLSLRFDLLLPKFNALQLCSSRLLPVKIACYLEQLLYIPLTVFSDEFQLEIEKEKQKATANSIWPRPFHTPKSKRHSLLSTTQTNEDDYY